MSHKRLRLPARQEDILALKAGDTILLDGEIVITAGIPTHERILEHLRTDTPLPIDLRGQALLHLGGFSEETHGHLELRYMNPTTSTRFNGLMPDLIRGLNLKVTGGKGGLDAASVRAMQEVGCVYLSFLGGGCTLLSQAIRQVEDVAWNDLIVHYRLTKLKVEGLGPATVAIDAHGRSLYEQGAKEAEARLPAILEQLRQSRVTPLPSKD